MTDVDGAVSTAFDRVLGSQAIRQSMNSLLDKADFSTHANLKNRGLLRSLCFELVEDTRYQAILIPAMVL